MNLKPLSEMTMKEVSAEIARLWRYIMRRDAPIFRALAESERQDAQDLARAWPNA